MRRHNKWQKSPGGFAILKGTHRERNQPVPVPGFKTFCYRALNICSKIRGGAKNNQCHGTVALARWAPLDILDTKVRLVSVFRYLYLTLKRELVLVSYFKNHWSPFSVKYHYSLVLRDQYWSLFIVKSRYVEQADWLKIKNVASWHVKKILKKVQVRKITKRSGF